MRYVFPSRVRSASLGVLLAVAAMATPVSAAPTVIPFTLSTPNDTTTIVPCPPGTPRNIVLCGYAHNAVMTATNAAGDPGLTGTVTDSYISVLEAPAPTTDCPAAMKPHSAGTITTSRGTIAWVTAGGSFCTTTGLDIEPLRIVGGTGAYKNASGSGVVTARQTSPTSSALTFQATLILPS